MNLWLQVQLLYPGWQTADSAYRWALSNLCCPTAWDPVSNPWVRNPAQDSAQGSLLTRARSPGHGEMGSKWRWQALREGPGWVCMYRRQRILQSQTRLASPEKAISGRTDWESPQNMTPEKEPFLTLFLPSSRFFLRPSCRGWYRKLKTCCLIPTINILPS